MDVLFQDAASASLTVTTLFSPEHGLSGVLDTAHVNGGQHFGIADSRDVKTGLPIISLFGDSDAQRHPQPRQMRSLDAVIIDLQDAGVRFYTYETAVGYFLEAGAKTGTEIIVLDRPNPINGITVQGPMSAQPPELYQLQGDAGATRHDDGRTGHLLQGGKPFACAAHGGADGKLASPGLV